MLGVLISILVFFRFENGWRASTQEGGASVPSPGAAATAAYDPETEEKVQLFFV